MKLLAKDEGTGIHRAGLGIWGAINLLEGCGNDNPGAKGQNWGGQRKWTKENR